MGATCLRSYESRSGSMEQVVLVNCALAAQRAGGWEPRLAPTAFKMSPLRG